MTLGRAAGRPGFTEHDVHDALDIGRRAGLSLHHAAMYWRQRHYAESLQRSLLTRLPEPDHLHVVARYVPAAKEAQVGGDWYDAFLQPDGATVLVVGDVTGHDIAAAAMMGQLRNLVRGTAYDRHEPPAAVLERVDRALFGLQVDTLATVVLARIEQTEDDRRQGLRRLRWSNAGHLPPAVLRADGTVELLDRPSDLLLGLDPLSPRTDHDVVLRPDDTVLLYTDGLVERTGQPARPRAGAAPPGADRAGARPPGPAVRRAGHPARAGRGRRRHRAGGGPRLRRGPSTAARGGPRARPWVRLLTDP